MIEFQSTTREFKAFADKDTFLPDTNLPYSLFAYSAYGRIHPVDKRTLGFGCVVLGLESCLRQPDRNDDAIFLIALERGRD